MTSDRKMIRATRSILERVDWPSVNAVVAMQQKARNQYSPVISLYRWWARRPHALIGALLDASSDSFGAEGMYVSDPFSGGGTVAFEAAARGLSVYAQDLYPWPTFCLATGLSKPAVEEMETASVALLKDLDALRSSFRRRDGRELTHVLRVRRGKCQSCSHDVFLFPNVMFSVASRGVTEAQAFYGCSACGNVERGDLSRKTFSCSACGWKAPTRERKRIVVCPHCSSAGGQKSYYGEDDEWRPVLVQEPIEKRGQLRAVLREVEAHDPVDFVSASDAMPEFRVPIPDGVETRRLLQAGFRFWGDLYTSRQAAVIIHALSTIMAMNVSEGCRDRMALAVMGAGEMPAFLSRWDRFYAKAYEGVANHRYAHTTLAAETNLLAPLGRGTLLSRLKSALKALNWAQEKVPEGAVAVHLVNRKRRGKARQGVRIATGDSRSQGLRSGSIDVVLTDPPYFDDVQYGELARLFHFWLSQYRDIGEVDESREAVPNSQRGNGAGFYESAIGDCLKESGRTLKDSGCLVLTFHNRSLRAWKSLARALISGGFIVEALVVARAESSSDLTKRDGRGLLHDLVLECVKRRAAKSSMARIVYAGDSEEEKNILAVGMALDHAVRNLTPESMDDNYLENLSKLGARRTCIQCGRKP
ncbi:MAG: hypothetical protein JW836_14595 [Deltaproteobacteria bacterium]|nr:hypothetical protein [Deltaproteobacteria bacterium]